MSSLIGLRHGATLMSTSDPASRSIVVGRVPSMTQDPTRLRLEERDLMALKRFTELIRARISSFVETIPDRTGTSYWFSDGRKLFATGNGDLSDFNWSEDSLGADPGEPVSHHPVRFVEKVDPNTSGDEVEIRTWYLVWDNGREDAFKLKLNSEGVDYTFRRQKDPVSIQVLSEERGRVEKLSPEVDETRSVTVEAEIGGEKITADFSSRLNEYARREAARNHFLTMPLDTAEVVVQFGATVLREGLSLREFSWMPPSFEQWAAREEEEEVEKMQITNPFTSEEEARCRAMLRKTFLTRNTYFAALEKLGHLEASILGLTSYEGKSPDQIIKDLETAQTILWLCGEQQRALELTKYARALADESTGTH